MGRPGRVDVGGYAYHVLNRAVGRRRIFHKDADYAAFERVLTEAVEQAAGEVQLLTYCVMPNHWHLGLRTTVDGALGPFMQWLTLTHTQRYRVSRATVGHGPVYQGRYKSFVIERGGHLLTVCRYAERNAARAGLVKRAEDWPWSSLWRWRSGDAQAAALLSRWPTRAGTPTGRPSHWLRTVNTPLNEPELEAMRTAANRCQPYGTTRWRDAIVARFGLDSTLRRPGRPRHDEP